MAELWPWRSRPPAPRVALVSRDADRLAAVFGEIQASGSESQFFLADVAREEDVRRVEGEIITTFGRADILIKSGTR